MSKGHPALTASGTAWLLEMGQEELAQSLMASAQPLLMSHPDLGRFLQHSCLQIWELAGMVEVFRDTGESDTASNIPSKNREFKSSRLHLQTFLLKQDKCWKWTNLLRKFFLLKNTQRCRAPDQLEGIHRTPEETPGQVCLWLSWGRGIPDTFTRASSLHQQQKGGWGPAPKQQETSRDQHDLFKESFAATEQFSDALWQTKAYSAKCDLKSFTFIPTI